MTLACPSAARPSASSARAHAKVNLDLRVLGTRADGYHELRTVFQTIELHDTLTAQEKPGPFVLKCRTPVCRSTTAIWCGGRRPRCGRRSAVPASRPTPSVTLDKAIPMQAGPWRRQRRRGGGAAGAGAAVGRRAAVRCCARLRPTVGADVPFFLSGGTALGLGRGEEIYPLVDLPPHWIVIVRPPFGVSTVEAYAWYDEDRAAGVREPRELQMLPVPWPTRAAQMINDLEPPVVRRHPEIGAIKAALREAGAVAAAMSGSGSAVFGLFRRSAAAPRALKPLAEGGDTRLLTPHVDPRRARAPRPSGCQAVRRPVYTEPSAAKRLAVTRQGGSCAAVGEAGSDRGAPGEARGSMTRWGVAKR